MNGHSSPQMMMAKPKHAKTFLRDNLGLGLGLRGWFFVFFIIYQHQFLYDYEHDINMI